MSPVVKKYFEAFNAKNLNDMLACVSEDVQHHVNEGDIRIGKPAFRSFCAHMNDCYDEHLADLVIFAAEDGTRAAAEFTVNGKYLKTDEGLPEASGQAYVLSAGSFFTIGNGMITRVTTRYNLSDWIKQVS